MSAFGSKLRKGEGGVYFFHCPGCNRAHPYHTEGSVAWKFNGDGDRPTFTPSLLVYPTPVNEDGTQCQKRCHLFLADGKITYCGDSEHAFAGRTVDCPDWPHGDGFGGQP